MQLAVAHGDARIAHGHASTDIGLSLPGRYDRGGPVHPRALRDYSNRGALAGPPAARRLRIRIVVSRYLVGGTALGRQPVSNLPPGFLVRHAAYDCAVLVAVADTGSGRRKPAGSRANCSAADAQCAHGFQSCPAETGAFLSKAIWPA